MHTLSDKLLCIFYIYKTDDDFKIYDELLQII